MYMSIREAEFRDCIFSLWDFDEVLFGSFAKTRQITKDHYRLCTLAGKLESTPIIEHELLHTVLNL